MMRAVPPPDDSNIFRQIRAHIAFEHMLFAVLIGAAASSVGAFFLTNISAALGHGWGLGALIESLVDALWTLFLVFLIGFSGSLVIGGPLFLFLERIEMRRGWPFFAAALAVEFVTLILLTGRIPDLGSLSTLAAFVPGVIIVAIFWRRVGPQWRAAADARRLN